jgi:hypothetical protein
VLCDRWGSPPDREGKYTSGIEEEFQVALECLQDADMPMKELIVFFKAVDAKHLSDPGEQLQAVLKFKKSLEGSKEHLYHNFDEPSRFEHLLLRHLAGWVRENERK